MPASQRQSIMVAEWCPDMPDLASATNIAINVVPATPQSYGPFKNFVSVVGNTMDGKCLGAIAIQDQAGTTDTFTGSADKLYLVSLGPFHFTDVSGAAYSVPSGGNWRFVLYNSTTVIATDYADVLQSYVTGVSATFGPLFTGTAWAVSTAYGTVGQQIIANGNRYTLVSAGTSAATGTGPSGTGVGITDGTALWNYQSSPPPLAQFIATPKNFLMLGFTSDPVGGVGPQRIWWGVSGDPTSFPAPGSEAAIQGMSDFNDFQGNFGAITGLVDSLANADIAIFFKRAVWRGNFVGPPQVFDFFPTENVRGCPAPNSIVPLGAIVYYLGEDGFYQFDGAQSLPIGTNKFDQWFWATVNQNFLNMVIGAPNVSQKTIMWAFPSTASVSGACDTLLAYRWDIQRASYITLGASTIEWLMRGLTIGGAASYPLSLAAVNSSHQFGYFTGSNMAAQVACQTVQLSPGRRTFFQSARPLVDLTSGTPTIAVSGRVDLYDTETFGADVPPDASGECPQRNDARYHDALIKISAAGVWTHIEGVDATFTGSGYR